jgi:hypothetical protein
MIKQSFLAFFVILSIFLLTACESDVEFQPYKGFNFGMTKLQVKNHAKHCNTVFSYQLLAFKKKFDNLTGTVYLIFENKGKLNAYDIRFYPYLKKPETARKIIFTLRETLNKLYGKGKNVTKSHKNFSTLYSIWDLKNATILLGIYEKDYKFLPKIIVVQKSK